MTFQELLEQLQKLSPEALAGKADVLDQRLNIYYPVVGIYNTPQYESKSAPRWYTFITFTSKE